MPSSMHQSVTKGHFLIAEPSIMGDVTFNRSVILIADHKTSGSVGFIVNKPLEVTLCDFIPQVENLKIPVYNGGPVEQDNLYFVHKVPQFIPESIEIADGIYWGGDFESVIKQLNSGIISSENIKFFLGYSGWETRQLANELKEGVWVVTETNCCSKLFSASHKSLWRDHIMALGGDYLIWSNCPENPSHN